MDRGVVPAVRAQDVGVGRADLGRGPRQLDRVVAQGADGRCEVGLAVVVRGVPREPFVCALCTEVVCVGVRSVVAVVLAGDDHREKLSFLP